MSQDEKFLKLVLDEVEDGLGPHLNGSSLIKSKALIGIPLRRDIDSSLAAELFGGLEGEAARIP